MASPILVKFERETHKTQLHGMMRAFCCTYFRISVPCVRIHNLEKKLRFFCFSIFFQYHLFVKPFHYHVVYKFHIIMMHALENIMFEKIHIFLPLAAILSNLHNFCKKVS